MRCEKCGVKIRKEFYGGELCQYSTDTKSMTFSSSSDDVYFLVLCSDCWNDFIDWLDTEKIPRHVLESLYEISKKTEEKKLEPESEFRPEDMMGDA